METKDHYYLSKKLADSMTLNKLNKLVFILGNLIPDINPFSYIARIGGNRFSGHSYAYRRPFMKKVLEKRCTGTPLWWYQTGVMTHYLADSFTRPHNENFQYSLKDHVEYEHQLHELLVQWLDKDLSWESSADSIQPLLTSSRLEEKHEAYMKESRGPVEDCRYILQTVAAACHLQLSVNCLRL